MFGVATGGFWALVGSIFLLRSYLLAHYRYRIWRLIRTLLVVVLVGFVVSWLPLQVPVGRDYDMFGGLVCEGLE